MGKQRKMIQINPDFFRLGKRTKRKRERKRYDFKKTIKPNNIKKQLIARIKAHQQREHKQKTTSNGATGTTSY